MFDPPRDDSKATIAPAKAKGVRVKMVTGDDTAIANRDRAPARPRRTNIISAADVFPKDIDPNNLPPDVAEAIERADGFARVFPEHKYAIVKALQKRGHLVAMTGDGVNDAPALKQADCGVAVSGATDAARGAAALILTAPGLSVIDSAIDEARRIFGRIESYTHLSRRADHRHHVRRGALEHISRLHAADDGDDRRACRCSTTGRS